MRYENWPLPFVLSFRIRVLLCAFEFSAFLCNTWKLDQLSIDDEKEFEPRPNGVAPISIYFQPSHCPRWLAIDMGPNPVYNPRLALLRRKKLLMKKHTMSVMVREQIKLIAESNKRYENWPLPFVLLSRIRVRLCGFCLSLTLCLITH